MGVIGGPGGDLLFRTLRCSTIGAEGFHGRVRDGIGCFAPRYDHQAGQTACQKADIRCQISEGAGPVAFGVARATPAAAANPWVRRMKRVVRCVPAERWFRR